MIETNNKQQIIKVFNRINEIAKENNFVYTLSKETYTLLKKNQYKIDQLSIAMYLEDFINLYSSNPKIITFENSKLFDNPLPKIVVENTEVPIHLIVHTCIKNLQSKNLNSLIKRIKHNTSSIVIDKILTNLNCKSVNCLVLLSYNHKELFQIKQIQNCNLNYYHVFNIESLQIPIHSIFK